MWPFNVLQTLLFPSPPSIFVSVMSIVSIASLANLGLSEIRGKHLSYSKFLNWNNNNTNVTTNNSSSSQQKPPKKQINLSSKMGMFVLYFPAFLFGLASFFIFPDEGLRFLLLRLALTIHFLKRVLEVLFVHRYGDSGVALDSAILISLSYFSSTATMFYAQHVSNALPEPSFDLTYPGVALFLLGIGGNFYHHYILASLRGEGEKQYKIPKGGLFGLVICPHYFFEVLGFVGVSLIAQTIYSVSFTTGTALYLLGRSYATKKWYMSKFEDFPTDIKIMIPFIL